jgi:hypothetical protein
VQLFLYVLISVKTEQMPKVRKTTRMLELTGQMHHNKGRHADRLHEPVPTKPIGPPPKDMTPEEKACWRELIRITPEAVLFNTDRWWVELSACLMAAHRNRRITTSDRAQLITLLSRMGLNPSDRSRVSAPVTTKDENPFAEIAANR